MCFECEDRWSTRLCHVFMSATNKPYWKKGRWADGSLSIPPKELYFPTLKETFVEGHLNNLQSSWYGEKELGTSKLSKESYIHQCEQLKEHPHWLKVAAEGDTVMFKWMKDRHPVSAKDRRLWTVEREVPTPGDIHDTDHFRQLKQHVYALTCAVAAVGTATNRKLCVMWCAWCLTHTSCKTRKC